MQICQLPPIDFRCTCIMYKLNINYLYVHRFLAAIENVVKYGEPVTAVLWMDSRLVRLDATRVNHLAIKERSQVK